MSIMDQWHFETHIQNEALINELKGGLFEYQVGRLLAQNVESEDQFITASDASELDRLKAYEIWLRQYDPHLLKQIPHLAMRAKEKLIEILPSHFEVAWVGKKAAGSGVADVCEADLVIYQKSPSGKLSNPEFISLKLCKSHAYVNTKSGGCHSFIAKYFASFGSLADEIQKKFNHNMDRAFWEMGENLYQAMDLGTFQGTFDQEWQIRQLPELPGQLTPELKRFVHNYYFCMIRELHLAFTLLIEKEPELFRQCLWPLLGLGARNIIQLVCFHETKKDIGAYQFHSLALIREKDVESALMNYRLEALKPEISSFLIDCAPYKLQLRLKPMNKFTAKSLKVNCSILGH